jgi:hypothetical protein
MVLWSLRTSKANYFDGIGLVDFRGSGNSFSETMRCSLRLIQEQDTRRYARVTKHIVWIVNQINNALGAQYEHSIHALFVQFDDAPDLSRDLVIAIHAILLIHEATHGVIESRGIRLTTDNRVQIERLCTTEQNRFAARLSAYDAVRYPLELLQCKFDARDWEPEWQRNRAERGISFVKRWLADNRTR